MPSPVNYTQSRDYFRLFAFFCLLHFAICARSQQAGDSSRVRMNYHYHTVVLLSSVGMQFFGNADGLLSVSFPYTVTDASGTTTAYVFSEQKKNVYDGTKYYICPIIVEVGWLRSFMNFNISFLVEGGQFSGGGYCSVGYGSIWYPDHRHKDVHQKRLVIKTSLNITYQGDGSGGANLGTIDNADKTIYLLDLAAGPTFTTSGTRSSLAKTYNVKRLDVSYSQRELSLLPKLSIGNNPYRHGVRWEVAIGYNLPLADEGGLYLDQVADGASQGVAGPVNIGHNDITTTYNNKPIRTAPYRFGGLYVAATFAFGRVNVKKQDKAPFPKGFVAFAPGEITQMTAAASFPSR